MALMQVVATGSAVIVLSVSLLASLLSGWWLTNALTNFRQQLFVLGVVALALGTSLHALPLALIGAAIVLFNGAIVLVALRGPRGRANPDAAGQVLRVMSLNLLHKNRDREAVFRQIDHVRPDVLLLQEVGRHWARVLGRLSSCYPHTLRLPRDCAPFGHHGPILFSRHPILTADPQRLGGPTVRLAAARLAVGDLTLWVASVHASKPSNPAGFLRQRRQLEELAAWVNERDRPVLLGGDFNATSTAPQVLRFLADTGLILDQQAVPSQAFASTFPAVLPLLGLKIDHILVRGMAVRRAWTLPRVSSDHRGVVAEVALTDC